MSWWNRTLRAALTLASALGLATAAGAEPAVGEAAPDFELMGSDGKTYLLTDFADATNPDHKSGVVLAWFPKAFTPG